MECYIVRMQERYPENNAEIEAMRTRWRNGDLQYVAFMTWCEACGNDLDRRRSRANIRYMDMEREAKKEASIEAAVNIVSTAFKKKHKASGWKKFAYKDVRSTSVHLP